jgi:hypothetical protein
LPSTWKSESPVVESNMIVQFADFRNLVRAFLLALLTLSFGSFSPVWLYLIPMIIGIPVNDSSVQFCIVVGTLLFSPCGMYTTAR